MQKFIMKSLEYNVSHSCNLKCSYCDHLSPYYSSKDKVQSEKVDLEKFEKSIAILAKYAHCESFLVLGGEPLLNKDILSFLRVIKDSSITSEIVLVTNGYLLSKQPDELFELLDRINLSLYSSAPLDDSSIDLIKSRCSSKNVSLEISTGTKFIRSISSVRNEDPSLVHKIFKTCSLAWKQRCFTLYDSYLFRCSRIPFIGYKLNQLGIIERDISYEDGLKISDDSSFPEDMRAYFQSTTPLNSCNYCFGSVGMRVPHRQLEKHEIEHNSWVNDRDIKHSIDYIKLYRRLIKLKLLKSF